MSPRPPRKKPRSPGQRQFSPGTPGQWAKVAQSPHVQRALQDPQIANALYQNFRQTGGQMPPMEQGPPMQQGPPLQMQQGGGVPTPEQVNQIDQMRGGDVDPETADQLEQLAAETRPVRMQQGGGMNESDALDMNEIAQMMADPNASESRKQSLRLALARAARARVPQPQFEEPPERPTALRFADGGATSIMDLDAQLKQYTDDLQQATAAGDTARITKDNQAIADINKKKATMNPATGGSMAPQASATASPGGVSLGPNMNISGSTMGNLSKLTGPMTPGNEAAAIGVGALLGGGSSGSGAGALIGGATAGLLNYFIRKNAQAKQQQAQQAQQQRTQSPAGGAQNASSEPNATAPSAASSVTPSAPSPPATGSDDEFHRLQRANVEGNADSVARDPRPTNAPSSGLMMGSTPDGNATSNDGGQTWTNSKTGNPIPAGQVINQTQIGGFGPDSSPAQMAPAAVAQAPEGSGAPGSLSMVSPQFDLPGQLSGLGALSGASLPDASLSEAESGGEFEPEEEEDIADEDYAKGGPVKPPKHGLAAIPVLHIVIAPKPAMSGALPQSERRPRKPKAVPPLVGPQPSGARLPHGRVQVPRGSGAAIRGKRFGGIF